MANITSATCKTTIALQQPPYQRSSKKRRFHILILDGSSLAQMLYALRGPLLKAIVVVALSASGSVITCAQVQANAASPTKDLVNSATASSTIQRYVRALGDRLTKPGKERAVLVGTFTSGAGSGQAQMTWEAPGNFRFDRAGQPNRSIVYDAKNGVVRSAGLSQDEIGIFESLLDDGPEAFVFGATRGVSRTLLGLGIRTDNGKAATYNGPWVDVYLSSPPSMSRPTSTTRKAHIFDSATGLLLKTQYTAGDGRQITTEFRDWKTADGQSFPRTVVRNENGTAVFTLTVASVSVAPAASDNAFSNQ